MVVMMVMMLMTSMMMSMKGVRMGVVAKHDIVDPYRHMTGRDALVEM